MILDFSVIRQKHALTCPGLYRLIFKSLYHTFLILPLRWAIDETVNFRNFRKLFTNKCAAFWEHFGTHLQTRKTKRSGRAHELCCNGRHLYIGAINVATRR